MKLNTTTLLGLASSTALFALTLTANAAPVATAAPKSMAPASKMAPKMPAKPMNGKMASKTKMSKMTPKATKGKTTKMAAHKGSKHPVHHVSAKMSPKMSTKAPVKG